MFSLDHYRAFHTGVGQLDRSSHGRLLVAGADRRRYLQGLLTNDIEALTPGSGCYAAYLTAQGRMIADTYVYETGDSLLVTLERDVAATVAERWSTFVFSEDVTVTDLAVETRHVALLGPGAGAALARAADGLPGAPDDAALAAMAPYSVMAWPGAGAGAGVICTDESGVRELGLVLPAALAFEVTARFRAAGVTAVDARAIEACRIEAGIPRYGVDMDEDTIPLEAGIESRAISLTKGCYVGQEIVIRVLHRGQGRVARRLVGLVFDAGAPVVSANDAVAVGARDIGRITSATWSPKRERPVALGYVHREFVEPGTRVAVRHDGATLDATVASLPFDW